MEHRYNLTTKTLLTQKGKFIRADSDDRYLIESDGRGKLRWLTMDGKPFSDWIDVTRGADKEVWKKFTFRTAGPAAAPRCVLLLCPLEKRCG